MATESTLNTITTLDKMQKIAEICKDMNINCWVDGETMILKFPGEEAILAEIGA